MTSPESESIAVAEKIKQEIYQLSLKLLLAALQVAAMILFLLLHHAMSWAATQLMPADFVLATKLVETILAVGFVVVSLQLTFDMVCVFVPALRRYNPREGGGVDE